MCSDLLCWRHGETSEVETLQRTASSDAELPGAGQLDWKASDADSGAQTGNLTICSVITTWEQKSHPAGHELRSANSMVKQLEEPMASHCLNVWPLLLSTQLKFIQSGEGLKSLSERTQTWWEFNDFLINNYEIWNEL